MTGVPYFVSNSTVESLRDEYAEIMTWIRNILIFSVMGMAGCSTMQTDRHAYSPVRASCPEGTTMICVENSLRGCGCGELIVLN